MAYFFKAPVLFEIVSLKDLENFDMLLSNIRHAVSNIPNFATVVTDGYPLKTPIM